MNKKILVVLLLNLIIFSAFAQEKLSIAIIDFQGNGISLAEARTLTEELRTHLVKSKMFMVIERNNMEEILIEQGIQQTGCTTAECAVEVGKLLNVQKMIAGSIGRVGSLFTIHVRILDVESGQIEHTFSGKYEGEIEGLVEIMSDVSDNIVSRTIEETEEADVDTDEKLVYTLKKKLFLKEGFGIKAGLNISNPVKFQYRPVIYYRDLSTEHNTGYNLGVFVRFPIGDFYFIQPELSVPINNFNVIYLNNIREFPIPEEIENRISISFYQISILVNYLLNGLCTRKINTAIYIDWDCFKYS